MALLKNLSDHSGFSVSIYRTFIDRQNDLPGGLMKRTGFGGISSYMYILVSKKMAV